MIELFMSKRVTGFPSQLRTNDGLYRQATIKYAIYLT